MSITALSANATTTDYTGQSSTDVIENELDRNAFMKLLVTQMQYQDPMAPMANEEFIAQLAQFSSLEQMQQMNSKLDIFAGSMLTSSVTGLLGRTVTVQLPQTADPIIGVVDGIVYEEGQPKISIDGQVIDPGYITAIK